MSTASDTTNPAFALLDVDETVDGVTISGVALGMDTAALEAELKVERQGSSGNVTLNQHKHLDITPGARVVFGTVSVSFASGDSLVAMAILSSGGRTIAETRTIIGTNKNMISGGN